MEIFNVCAGTNRCNRNHHIASQSCNDPAVPMDGDFPCVHHYIGHSDPPSLLDQSHIPAGPYWSRIRFFVHRSIHPCLVAFFVGTGYDCAYAFCVAFSSLLVCNQIRTSRFTWQRVRPLVPMLSLAKHSACCHLPLRSCATGELSRLVD